MFVDDVVVVVSVEVWFGGFVDKQNEKRPSRNVRVLWQGPHSTY